jgi:hypothetical protein
MPGILKDGRFWGGLIVGYLLCMFVPGLSLKGLTGKKSG